MTHLSKIVAADPNPDSYSKLHVMESRAGFYLGTLYCAQGFESDRITPKDFMCYPGSRDTHYMTKDEAERTLSALENPTTSQKFQSLLRTHP